MNYYLNTIKRSLTFDGRASRYEWWCFSLINISINIVIQGVFALLIFNGITLILLLKLLRIFNLIMWLPSVAVTIRRLHDINKNIRSLLLLLIPLIGLIWFLVLMAKDGDQGDNQYGVNPKDAIQHKTVVDTKSSSE